MTTKIEKVIVGDFGYDSIVTTIDGKKMEICFKKKDNVSKYNGKTVEIIENKGIYSIKEISQNK